MSDKEFWANEYVKHLPPSLQEKLRKGNSDLFVSACAKGVIVFEDGRWISHFVCTSHLAFFCGRCFCKDKPVGSKLFKGKNNMPVKELERLFGVHGLKGGRKNYRRRKISGPCKNAYYLADNCL